MLHEIFYWILNMSIIASVFGFFIYSLRLIKGFPKFGCYVLWAVVLIRFLCPLGLSSRYSLLHMLNYATQKLIVRTVSVDIGKQHQLTVSNMVQAASTYEPFTYKTNLLEEFFRISSVIWVIIAVAAMLAMMIMYYLTTTELKKATHLRDNVYSSRLVDTPTVYGIIKPKIVLPAGVEQEQLKYILAHERVHIRRHDNIWRMIAILTACVHWFNPLIWWFLKAFLTDTELACDIAAVKRMKEEERKNYAKTLLAFASREKTVFASAFGSSKVRVRIENILTYRKLTLISTISFVGMGLTIAFLLLTNATVIK